MSLKRLSNFLKEVFNELKDYINAYNIILF